MSSFLPDFMFELEKEELENLRCQIGTSSWGGTRYTPMAFTEQGVAMLSSVLNSKRAIKVNIAIMLETRLTEHDENFRIVFQAIKQLFKDDEKPERKIGF